MSVTKAPLPHVLKGKIVPVLFGHNGTDEYSMLI